MKINQNNKQSGKIIEEERTTPQGLEQSKARWAVVVARSIPMFGLERSTVKVNDAPAIIAARIDESLRLRSVEVQFDASCAEATCKTRTFLHYKITLYTGPSNSTYVEVLRMKGCGYEFALERQAIIHSAKGLGAVQLISSFHKTLKIPSDIIGLYVPPSINELENDLDRMSDQFHSNNRCSALATLQNLAILTDVEKVHTKSAQNLSRLIMQNQSNVRDIIVSIYACEAMDINDKMSEQMCNACLCILVNGIVSLSKNDAFFDRGECRYFIESLMPCIRASLENLESSTHNACLALRCLYELLGKSLLANNKVREMNMSSVVEQAVLFGSREHSMLENTARITIDRLQNELVAF